MIIIAFIKLKSMKKLLITGLITTIALGINAQEAAEKKVLAGISLGTGMNFNNPQTNAIDSKVGADFIAGMAIDWHFSNNIALSTGLEFEFNRFRHEFNDPTLFEYNDKEIAQRGNEDDDGFSSDPEGTFNLDERRYRNIYLSLPVMLRFQTGYMGYLRYFGKFGLRNNFLLQTRGDNFGNDLASDKTELEDMRIPGDLSFYKGSIGLSVGAEWNFAGSTVLVGEIGYYYGFTEIHQQDAITGDEDKNRSLYIDNDGDNEIKVDREYFSPSAKQGQLLLKATILF